MNNCLRKRSYALIISVFALFGCDDGRQNENSSNVIIKIATCADYPPFTYYRDGNLAGLDIELCQLLAQELGKTVVFEDMQFGAILVSIQDGIVDAAIGAIEPSKEKRKNCDFTDSYCRAGYALVRKKDAKATSLEQLTRNKVAYQNGSLCHLALLREKAPLVEPIAMDKMNSAIETLKAGHVDYILMDEIPAKEFCKKNNQLTCSFVAESKEGYALMLRKGSPLRTRLNEALKKLESEGKLKKIMAKYL
ncbi:MAG: ABC transporter substrate-binding protein [Holosporaceae bacterium]|nr:ABC transporter substrate-binding protein [Holosporaceae bacterium]